MKLSWITSKELFKIGEKLVALLVVAPLLEEVVRQHLVKDSLMGYVVVVIKICCSFLQVSIAYRIFIVKMMQIVFGLSIVLAWVT